MSEKVYKLRAEEFKELAPNRGACIATDMIVVDGDKVGFMYRETPDIGVDSGWRFMSGRESQEYMDDPSNLAFYDINTIANYDADIVPYLNSPIGSAFERQAESGPFTPVEDFDADG